MCYFFFFNDTATTEIYTLSLHDALPISGGSIMTFSGNQSAGIASGIDFNIPPTITIRVQALTLDIAPVGGTSGISMAVTDRKSTRLNSSHLVISYAVFCLKKKQI